MVSSTRIRVATASPYDVVVGHGLLDELPALVAKAQRVAVIHPAALRTTGDAITKDLVQQGFEAQSVAVPDGERSKDLKVAAYLWDVLGQSGFTRTDAIVAVGGGATTDLAGFAAATWLRGVDVVHVPTTLLGMVDAAVIEAAVAKTIAEVFYDNGEEHFRALERAAVARALDEHGGVLSLGGGGGPRPRTRARLQHVYVVFLNVGLADAAKRVGLSRDRPVLALNPRAVLNSLRAERLPLYREVADHEVGTDGRTPQEVAADVASRVSG